MRILSDLFVAAVAAWVMGTPAWANHERFKPTCAEKYLAGLPDPFAVDAEDAEEILRFVGGLITIPTDGQPGALNEALTRLWHVYRPNLSLEAIEFRLRPLRFSAYALQTLRRNSRVRLPMVGKLRLVWFDFLRDVDPVDPRHPGALARHRALALIVRLETHAIREFLSQQTGREVEGTGPAVGAALDALREKFGVATINGLNGRKNSVLTQWDLYLNDLGESNGRRSKPLGERVALRRGILPSAPTDFAKIRAERAMILSFLMQRYQDLRIDHPYGLAVMINRLRAEHGCAPSDQKFAKYDLRTLAYNPNPAAEMRLMLAWSALAKELSER